MKKLVWLAATLAMLVAFAPGHADAANRYIGTKKCKMCHRKAYKAWENSKHAHAFESLEKANAANKPAILSGAMPSQCLSPRSVAANRLPFPLSCLGAD